MSVHNINESMDFQKAWLWQQYAIRVTPDVQRVVEFAKRVPAFCDLSQDDQLILVKLGFFEIWLTHISRLINDQTITFDDGTCLTRQQLEILYDVSINFIFSNNNFRRHSSRNSLRLDSLRFCRLWPLGLGCAEI